MQGNQFQVWPSGPPLSTCHRPPYPTPCFAPLAAAQPLMRSPGVKITMLDYSAPATCGHACVNKSLPWVTTGATRRLALRERTSAPCSQCHALSGATFESRGAATCRCVVHTMCVRPQCNSSTGHRKAHSAQHATVSTRARTANSATHEHAVSPHKHTYRWALCR